MTLIEDFVDAVIDKINSLISSHNNDSSAHSTLLSGYVEDTDNRLKKNIFYGTSSTSASTQTKVVTVDGDWSFETGNILFVNFSNANSYNGTARISIDETVKDIASVGTTKTSRYYWKAGELIAFVYDGTNMLLLEGAPATTTYYGSTKLSSSVSSTSEALSATPKAVKTAYDLANGKADSVHTHTVSDVTDLTLPTDVSDLTDTQNTPFTPKSHNHSINEIDSLQSNLNGKANANHTHNIDELGTSVTGYTPVHDNGDGNVYILDKLMYNYDDEVLYYEGDDEVPFDDFIVQGDIPTSTSDLTNDGSDGSDTYVETGDLSSVATSGSYNDLTNKPTIPTSSSTNTDIKMDGTQSAGSSSNFAKADHVHPTDTSRVAVAQGSSNSGKFLKVDSSGNVAPESVTIPSAYTHPSTQQCNHNHDSTYVAKSQGTSNNGKFLKVSSGDVVCETVDIPDDVSDLTDSSGVIPTDVSDLSDSTGIIPTDTSDLSNGAGFLTSHQDISTKLNVSDVKDNLTSTDTDKPLSANQGKELKSLVDGKADSSHTHGQITKDGKVTTTVTVAGDDSIVITDFSDSSKIKRVNNLLAGHIVDSNAHTNIDTPANAMQSSINTKINNAIGNINSSLANKLEESDLLDLIYPIGSIYMSVNDVNPSTLFGGTWEQIKDKFLLSKGDTYSTNGATGGEANHTLTINEMPSHNHTTQLYGHKTNGGVSGKHRSVWSGNNDMAPMTWIDNTGGGQAHNNMPPYLVVNVWKRTA